MRAERVCEWKKVGVRDMDDTREMDVHKNWK